MKVIVKYRYFLERNAVSRLSSLVTCISEVQPKFHGWKIKELDDTSKVSFVFNNNNEFMFSY